MSDVGRLDAVPSHNNVINERRQVVNADFLDGPCPVTRVAAFECSMGHLEVRPLLELFGEWEKIKYRTKCRTMLETQTS
jgi:hypothetical protein